MTTTTTDDIRSGATYSPASEKASASAVQFLPSRRLLRVGLVILCVGSSVPCVAQIGAWEADLGWASRYIQEGVDALDGSAVLYGSARFPWYRIGVHLGGLDALGEDYSEFLLGVDYRMQLAPYELGDIDWGIGLRRIGYPQGELSHRWDVFGDLHWVLSGGVRLEMDVFAEMNRERGGFFVFGLHRPVEMRAVLVEPGVRIGLDYGLVSDSRRLRENHWECGVSMAWRMTESLHMVSSLKRTMPLRNLDDLSLDRTHTEVRIALRIGREAGRTYYR